jgi:LPS export ABC transporter ATP-binding protein|tara:strand:- start:771 stop:1490 length:720 start_codon:yes stop_codon:yes gene_type:complete
MTILSVSNLSKKIKNKSIIENINFVVNRSEILGLLGPNGAGKTTTFYTIAGLIKPSEGKISFNNKNVTDMPMHNRSKLGMSYLPQESSIFLNLSVKHNILGLAQLASPDTNLIKNIFDEVVEEFNLSKILNQKGRELSGGQRRRVEIARCLVTKPNMILMDEPFAGIDPIAVDDIKKILNKLVTKDISILITDHNVGAALEICNRALILSEGKILAEGSTNELINNNKVKEVYLGEMYS